jgi:hypothetical protein
LKLPRENAEHKTIEFMRAQKIGLMSGEGLPGSQIPGSQTLGSWLLPLKDQQRLFAKIDDVRYDLRKVGGRVSGSILVLGGALGLLGIASIFRTSKGQ